MGNETDYLMCKLDKEKADLSGIALLSCILTENTRQSNVYSGLKQSKSI